MILKTLKRKYQPYKPLLGSFLNTRTFVFAFLFACFGCAHQRTSPDSNAANNLKLEQISDWQQSIESIEARFWARLSYTRTRAVQNNGGAAASESSQSFPGKFYLLRSGNREWFRFDVKDPIGNGVASILSVYWGAKRLVIWVLHSRQVFAVASADTPTNQYINVLSTLAPMVAGLAPKECLVAEDCDAQFQAIPGSRHVVKSARWTSGSRKKNIIKLEHADYADLEEFDLPKKLTLSIDATEKSFELKLAIRDRMLKTCGAAGSIVSGEKSSEKRCSTVSQSYTINTFPQWVDIDALPTRCQADAACVTRVVQEQVQKHFSGYRLVDSSVLSIFD